MRVAALFAKQTLMSSSEDPCLPKRHLLLIILYPPPFKNLVSFFKKSIRHRRSKIGLMGNHLDVLTGKWTATDAGIGAGVDSYYEYLVKGAILLQRPELIRMFRVKLEHSDFPKK